MFGVRVGVRFGVGFGVVFGIGFGKLGGIERTEVRGPDRTGNHWFCNVFRVPRTVRTGNHCFCKVWGPNRPFGRGAGRAQHANGGCGEVGAILRDRLSAQVGAARSA